LKPDVPFGAPFYVRPPLQDLDWEQAAQLQTSRINELLQKSWDLSPRYAVFSFAPIPLAIQLGFLLTDRVETHWYQYDRDRMSWRWSEIDDEQPDTNFEITGLPDSTVQDNCEVVIRVSLSSQVRKDQTDGLIPAPICEIDLIVREPDPTWLQRPEQLVQLARHFRRILGTIRAKLPACQKIHLFYAGPTGGAIALGQQINPRMNPPIVLYEFDQNQSPQYSEALTIGG
jgi:hypothetical protein